MQPLFIPVSGRAINIERIDFINFRRDGVADVHVGANLITTEDEDEVKALRRSFYGPAPRDADAGQQVVYPCGCRASSSGPEPLPPYCPEHGRPPLPSDPPAQVAPAPVEGLQPNPE